MMNPNVLVTVDGKVVGLIKRLTITFNADDTLVRAEIQRYGDEPSSHHIVSDISDVDHDTKQISLTTLI